MGLDVLKLVLLSSWMVSQASAGVIRDAAGERACRTYTQDGLVHVDCADLGLTDLPEGLDYRAQVLNLENNNFVTLPSELQYFIRMEKLDLSGNHLSRLPVSYTENWANLHTLNLSNNNFETWSNFGLGASLRKLDLSKNKINNVDEAAFNEMMSLHFLDLSENRIYDLPQQVFVAAHNLDSLILSRNYFSAIPNFQSSSLRSLDLSSCQVAALSADALAGKTSLLEIDLSINQIEYIPDNFTSTTLQELKLSYNDINTLTDRSFSSLPHLAVLHLRGNDLKEVLSTSIFSSNPFLREVHLKGNRWNCEGFGVNLLLTYEYLTRDPPKVADKASLICYSPTNVTQLSWQQAYIATWHPEEGYSNYTWAAVMIGIIIGILLTSLVCRGLMSLKGEPETPRPAAVNLNGGVDTRVQARVESVVLRIPLHEDLPPTYDEALLMPRLNSSFHSLPDFVDEDEDDRYRRFRRSRSIGDLADRPRNNNRRSIRTHHTVEINIE